MLSRSRLKARLVLLVLLALLVIGSGLVWRSLQSGLEPGGGGANEFPQRLEADGSVVLRLRLNVWGGRLSYHYEVTLDGHATNIPGRLEVTAP